MFLLGAKEERQMNLIVRCFARHTIEQKETDKFFRRLYLSRLIFVDKCSCYCYNNDIFPVDLTPRSG